jgi:hypothetical protein
MSIYALRQAEFPGVAAGRDLSLRTDVRYLRWEGFLPSVEMTEGIVEMTEQVVEITDAVSILPPTMNNIMG